MASDARRQKQSSWDGKRFLRFSIVFSLLSIIFWMFIYFKSRRNEDFAFFGMLDGIPLGIVTKIAKTWHLNEPTSFTILCAQGASLLFWNFVAFIFSVRLKWLAYAAILLDIVTGLLILAPLLHSR